MIHSKNHNNKTFGPAITSFDGVPNRNKVQSGVGGFTIVEVIISLAITALVITPIFILHGTIFQRVNLGSNAFDMILHCKALLVEARQKQEPDAQDFTMDKPVSEFNATCTYTLDKTVDQKSSLASLPGLHKESVTIDWTEDGKEKARTVGNIHL